MHMCRCCVSLQDILEDMKLVVNKIYATTLVVIKFKSSNGLYANIR